MSAPAPWVRVEHSGREDAPWRLMVGWVQVGLYRSEAAAFAAAEMERRRFDED